MMNAHRSLLRALRIPGYLEPDGAQSNLFEEMVRFVKYMWERKLQLDGTISGQQDEMEHMGVQMEQQRASVENLQHEVAKVAFSAHELRQVLEAKGGDEEAAILTSKQAGGGLGGNMESESMWVLAGVGAIMMSFDQDQDGELNEGEMARLQQHLGTGQEYSAVELEQLCLQTGTMLGEGGGLTRNNLHVLYRDYWGLPQLQQDLAHLGIKLGPGPPVPAQAILSMSREQLIEARTELERAKMVRIAAQVDLEDEQRKNAELRKLVNELRGGYGELEETAEALKKKWLDEKSRRMLAEKRAEDAEYQLAAARGDNEGSREALIEMHSLLQHHVGEKERLQVMAWENQSSCAKLQERSAAKQQQIWQVAQSNRELQRKNMMLHMQSDRGKRRHQLPPQSTQQRHNIEQTENELGHKKSLISAASRPSASVPVSVKVQVPVMATISVPAAGQQAFLPHHQAVASLRGNPFG
jgi:hypothetical protein